MRHLDVVTTTRRVKGFVAAMLQIDPDSGDKAIHRLEPLEDRVGRLGEAGSDLIESGACFVLRRVAVREGSPMAEMAAGYLKEADAEGE